MSAMDAYFAENLIDRLVVVHRRRQTDRAQDTRKCMRAKGSGIMLRIEGTLTTASVSRRIPGGIFREYVAISRRRGFRSPLKRSRKSERSK